MYTITESLQTPCQIDMEITSACNHKCRYCYNYWRHDENTDVMRMSKETLDKIIDQIIENKAFNVVLTGGEPFTNFDVLLHGVKRLRAAGTLVSCNSNLTLATKEQLQALYDAGLPHILTSLASFDPVMNDMIFGQKGSFAKVVRNIRYAQEIGIKISINTVISRHSKDHVYKTGMLAYALGASNLFLTRVVPAAGCKEEVSNEFVLQPEEYIPALDDAIKLKEETGINVGSLIQYPVCFLPDVNRYADFVGRGCQAGRKMVCISVNGDTHACFHESTKSYGNVLTDGLKVCWDNMSIWRDNSIIPEDCQKCKWFRWCEGGCRVYADTLSSKDYMCRGSSTTMPDPVEDYMKAMPQVTSDAVFQVRQTKEGMRCREEKGYWLVHQVGAWITRVSPAVAQYLITHNVSGKTFTLADFPEGKEILADLLYKRIIEKKC